jgi:CRP-like cAMP-binding protein
MNTVIELAKNSSDAIGRVQLENVQFIADQFQSHELPEILHTSQTPIRRVGYGEFLIRQGEAGHEMFVVKTGSFTVSRRIKDKEVVLWTAEEGDVIGEMALISGQVRSASVLARKSSQVYVIDLAEFQRNAYHIPRWFMGVIEGLATRLRETNKKLDAFVTGSFEPVVLSDLMSLEIFENVREPGACRISGSLTKTTINELRVYVRNRLKQGVRRFHWDVSLVQGLDQDAMKFLVGLHRYLLNIRGTLRIQGSRKLQFPAEL